MSSSDVVLTADGLAMSYGAKVALKDVTLELSPGVSALVGPNGAGKSTLLRILAGVQPPTSGSVAYRGLPLRGRAQAAYRRRLGFLPQNPSWHGWMTARDVVGSFAWMRGVALRQVGQHVDVALRSVDLAERAGERADTLSGGQFQRLMLATALVHDPEVLLLDEPTVGLDPEQRQQFRGILAEAGRSRVVLISTHLLDDVATTAERLLVLDDGAMVFSGAPAEIAATFRDARIPLTTDLESAYISLLRGRGSR